MGGRPRRRVGDCLGNNDHERSVGRVGWATMVGLTDRSSVHIIQSWTNWLNSKFTRKRTAAQRPRYYERIAKKPDGQGQEEGFVKGDVRKLSLWTEIGTDPFVCL